MNNIKILLLTIILSILSCGSGCAPEMAPDGMMVEFLTGSTVSSITDSTPEFGWVVHSSTKNDTQSAFRILVSSDMETLAADQADMWDTKKRDSANSINVPYSGKALRSNTSYYWKVKTWCKLGGESKWSDIMEFTTGNIDGEYLTTRYRLKQTAVSPSKIIKKSDGHYANTA